MIQQAIHNAVEQKNLDFDAAKQVMGEIMSEETTQAQMASFLTGFRMKGESIEGITVRTAVMREKALKLISSFDVIGTVGTGGDEVGAFNTSTASTLVVAAGGVSVAKHGNRSVSSKGGAVDVLERPSANLALAARQSEELLEETGICFMFAQTYHPSMKYVVPVRKELAIQTVFNILGPLSNPTGATMQLLGMYDKSLVESLAKVLSNLDVTRGLVVCGADGLDEATVTGPTHACETRFGKLETHDITPKEVGPSRHEPSDVIGRTPEENAQITRDILLGELKGAKRGIMILNSTMGLYLGIGDCIIEDCARKVAGPTDSGMAYAKPNGFISTMKTC